MAAVVIVAVPSIPVAAATAAGMRPATTALLRSRAGTIPAAGVGGR